MPNILVVDDSATQIALIQQMLVHQGFTVSTACNGVEALQRLQESNPDLVITDMQMPEMNGLELIRRMNRDWPLIPVVLVTAFGNEDLAAEALGVGAANYISKEHVGILLPEIVNRIVEFASANAQTLDLKGALTRTSFEFMLDSSVERITPLMSLLVRLLASMNVLHTGDRIRIAEAMNYLIFHSIIHGNLEQLVPSAPQPIENAIALVEKMQQDPSTESLTDRSVRLQFDVADRQARFIVSHEGSGPSFCHAPLPGTPQSFSDERGRGMLLLTSVMDEVFIHPVTNDVTLVKYVGK